MGTQMSAMTLVLLHGAEGPDFQLMNFFRDHLNNHDSVVINYNPNQAWKINLNNIHEQIKDFDKIFFVGLSLGGVYALHLYNLMPEKVLGACGISSPYGGVEMADTIKFMYPERKFLDYCGVSSNFIKNLSDIRINVPWWNIVTTQGHNNFLIKPNDGIVTIDSMTALKNHMSLIELAESHFTVVKSDLTVSVIEDCLGSIYNK
jgi:pimeloyl-ACP methyl ester carboxylesterase